MESLNSKRMSMVVAPSRSVSYEEKVVALALLNNPVSVSQLRELVWQKGGFQSNSLRLRAWSALLGVDRHAVKRVNYALKTDEIVNLLKTEPIHQQVELDVVRSMAQWTTLAKWSSARKSVKKKKIGDIIHALIAKHSSWAFYFQGFHDIVAAILIVTGDDHLTYALVEQLSQYYFRDCMRDNFELVSLLLKLLPGLIMHFDKNLACFLKDLDMPPFFALPWFITWFSHNVKDLNIVARLFDVFMGSHPLMPLYVSAALIINKKKSIISLNEQDDCVFGTLHECLSNLPRNVDLMGWEMILVDSRCMFEKLSPRDLLRQSSEFLRDEVMSHAPTSFEFPPPWFTKTSLPDWIQLQNQRHKLGKRKMKRRHKALQRIASTKACFSYEEINVNKMRKTLQPLWSILSFYEGRMPSHKFATSASVAILATVFGILLARKNGFQIQFL